MNNLIKVDLFCSDLIIKLNQCVDHVIKPLNNNRLFTEIDELSLPTKTNFLIRENNAELRRTNN